MSTASWFREALLPWYRQNHRPLPWRRTADAYPVWLSEVVLQQTRVDQGTAYWWRFMDRFPTVAHLAAAHEDEVLRLWQGLGYYSRARNLLAAARQVMDQHGGAFPRSHAELRGLKGVGDYTAAAIASICFGAQEAVVDGNVFRVLARVFGMDIPIDTTEGRKRFKQLAQDLLDPDHPGEHNQAVMELGALVCLPRGAKCAACPLAARCIARQSGRIAELPVKAGRTAVRVRHFNYLHIPCCGGFHLRKRTGKDIWLGLWEPPLLETPRPMGKKALNALLAARWPGARVVSKEASATHLLSHQRIQAVFWTVDGFPEEHLPADWLAVRRSDLGRHALPRLVERWVNGELGGKGR
jgi:A/G-specific adenine glycosylase